MQLVTIDTAQGSRAGAVYDGKFVDLNATDPNLPVSVKDLLGLEDWQARTADAAERGARAGRFMTGRLNAPIPNPNKVICIGLNYRDHAAESGMPIPTEPICFSKFSHTIVGPDAEVRLPRVCEQVDYEVELVAVIGRRGKHIPKEQARQYVAGYTNGNDVSARDWQLNKPGKQWLLGKTPDTFAPIGPYLLTADEVADPHDLNVQLRLNGQTMQNSSTRELIFGIDELVAYLSQIITLEPGDVIFTGTPPGVGMARKPPVFLKPGDVMEVEIDGLGILRNPVVADE